MMEAESVLSKRLVFRITVALFFLHKEIFVLLITLLRTLIMATTHSVLLNASDFGLL